MIILNNKDILKDAYKCGNKIKNYLVYTCHISILSYDDDGNYYFANTPELQKIVKEMPIRLKVLNAIGK